MERPSNAITKRRALAATLVLVLIFVGYFVRLFQVQIVDGATYAEKKNRITETEITVSAARGGIYDRYMRPLSTIIARYAVNFEYSYWPRGSSTLQQRNDIILSLTDLLSEYGDSWTDTLPITAKAPFTYLADMDSRIKSLQEFLRLSEYATPQQCLDKLIERYKLESYSAEQQRAIAGVQYELEKRSGTFSDKEPFTFSSDVSDAVRSILTENNTRYPGVSVISTTKRDYVNGDVASHLLGYVGPFFDMNEFETMKKTDPTYQLNDLVGKSGIEQAFESNLRGKSGTSIIQKNASGGVLGQITVQEPTPGDSIILTLDMEMQSEIQALLGRHIDKLRAQPDGSMGKDVVSGAVVLMDMQGGILTAATWPNYDLSTFQSEYAALSSDPDKPLLNRVLQEAYPIGSTMKPLIAMGALSTGSIPFNQTYNCRHTNGPFGLKCDGTHYTTDVRKALKVSCNIFFYQAGLAMGINNIVTYAKHYGLGQKTGIEISESTGNLAAPVDGESWPDGNTAQSAIGQGANAFTPMQLGVYANTLATKGQRWEAHLVKSIRSFDGSETPIEPQGISSAVTLDPEAIQVIHESMKTVTKPGGTANAPFSGASYACAGKTGTAQTGVSTKTNHSLFVGYAPADNPQVSIAVIMEQGSIKGYSNAAFVARDALDIYFDISGKNTSVSPTPEGVLLP